MWTSAWPAHAARSAQTSTARTSATADRATSSGRTGTPAMVGNAFFPVFVPNRCFGSARSSFSPDRNSPISPRHRRVFAEHRPSVHLQVRECSWELSVHVPRIWIHHVCERTLLQRCVHRFGKAFKSSDVVGRLSFSLGLSDVDSVKASEWGLFSRPLTVVVDIDECTTGAHNCSLAETCYNIQGGYRCLSLNCPPNYRKVSDTYVKLHASHIF